MWTSVSQLGRAPAVSVVETEEIGTGIGLTDLTAVKEGKAVMTGAARTKSDRKSVV